ncbi:hypothetical protein Pstu01_42670 [Stutzerimonas stutzeri]|nr:hypothetical protein Pstu01_42670 [Stutzerimonas stutzeri]
MLRINAEAGDFLGVTGNRHEMLGNRRLIAERLHAPGSRGMGVGQGFLGGEGFRANYKYATEVA